VSSKEEKQRVTALLSVDAPDGTTRYVDQLVDGAVPEVELLFFSWRRAFTGAYDLFHVHWPEFIIRDKSPLKRFAKLLAMRLLIAVLGWRGIPIVRTVHNLTPHEAKGGAEASVLRKLDQHTALFIRLNPTTPVRPGRGDKLILHGHYRTRFESIPRAEPTPGRILYLGLIRPYKGVEDLIAAFSDAAIEGSTLRIVGRPSHGLGDVVKRACDANDQISCRLEFVDDDSLVAEMTGADVVVLPYKQLENSGVALVALSLGRPIILPTGPATIALQEEVGPEWVFLYEGDFSANILETAVTHLRGRSAADQPNLSDRDWTTVGERHYAAYLDALERSRPPRRRRK
jgi:beta-1,4-mannosyltransferase